MYTRCSACGTIYEVGEDALQASLGIVRCGHCGERFDALERLSNELPPADDDRTPATGPAAHVPTLTHAVTTGTDPFAAAFPFHPADNVPTADASEPEEDGSTAPDANTAGSIARYPGSLSDLRGVVPPMVERDPGDEPVATPPAPAGPDLEVVPGEHAGDAAQREADAVPSREAAQPDKPDDPAEPACDEPGAFADPLAADADASGPQPPLVDTDAPVYVAPRRRVRRSDMLLAAGCLVLVAVLAAQVAWAERVALVLNPATQAWTLRACAAVGCRLPPIRDVSRLELLSRDVRPDPGRAGALMITATVRNDAPFTQPWPIVVTRLMDLDHRTVAMRRFRPSAYLPDAARRKAGIAPGTTAAIALEVVDPGRSAVSFHFSFD